MKHSRTTSSEENGPSGSTPPPSAEGVEFVKPEDEDYCMDCLIQAGKRAIRTAASRRSAAGATRAEAQGRVVRQDGHDREGSRVDAHVPPRSLARPSRPPWP
jgi:hypothetical protein